MPDESVIECIEDLGENTFYFISKRYKDLFNNFIRTEPIFQGYGKEFKKFKLTEEDFELLNIPGYEIYWDPLNPNRVFLDVDILILQK